MLSDRIVLTEKTNHISGYFSSVDKNNYEIMLSAKDVIIVKDISPKFMNQKHQAVKSFISIHRDEWKKVCEDQAWEFVFEAYGLKASHSFPGGMVLVSVLSTHVLYLGMEGRLASINESPERLFDRSYGAMVAMHLEACRFMNGVFNTVANKHYELEKKGLGLGKHGDTNELIYDIWLMCNEWEQNIKAAAQRLGLEKGFYHHPKLKGMDPKIKSLNSPIQQ